MKKKLQNENVLITSLAAVMAGLNLLAIGLYGFFVLKSEAQYIALLGIIFLPMGIGYYLCPRNTDCSSFMVNHTLFFLVATAVLNALAWKVWWILIVLALELCILIPLLVHFRCRKQ